MVFLGELDLQEFHNNEVRGDTISPGMASRGYILPGVIRNVELHESTLQRVLETFLWEALLLTTFSQLQVEDLFQ